MEMSRCPRCGAQSTMLDATTGFCPRPTDPDATRIWDMKHANRPDPIVVKPESE